MRRIHKVERIWNLKRGASDFSPVNRSWVISCSGLVTRCRIWLFRAAEANTLGIIFCATFRIYFGIDNYLELRGFGLERILARQVHHSRTNRIKIYAYAIKHPMWLRNHALSMKICKLFHGFLHEIFKSSQMTSNMKIYKLVYRFLDEIFKGTKWLQVWNTLGYFGLHKWK